MGGHDGRRHGRERSVTRPDRVGWTLDQPEHVWRAGLGREVVHLVVEEEAQAFGSGSAAEQTIEGVGGRDRVAIGVDHGVVRSLRGLGPRGGERRRRG